MNFLEAVSYLKTHDTLIKRAGKWFRESYVGLDDGGLYFSAGIPGTDNCVIIDFSPTVDDIESEWIAIELSDEQRENLLDDRGYVVDPEEE